MVDKEFDRLILKAGNIKLEPYDIFQKENTLTWIDDNNWFLTIIEFISSSEEKEIFLNIGLNFLWYSKKIFTFDFLKEQISVKYNNIDDFYSNLMNLMQISLNKALDYRKFRNLFYAKEQILQAKYNVWKFNYYKMIMCFLCDDVEMGKKYFSLFSNNIGLNNEANQFIDEQKKIYASLLSNNDSTKIREFVYSNVLNNINEQRKFYNQNFINRLSTYEDAHILKALNC